MDSDELIAHPGLPAAGKTLGVPPPRPAAQLKTNVDSEQFPVPTPDFLVLSKFFIGDSSEVRFSGVGRCRSRSR